MNIAIGEALLSAHGALSILQIAKDKKDWKTWFEQNTRLNKLLREINQYKWSENNFVERQIWIPQHKRLLNRIRTRGAIYS